MTTKTAPRKPTIVTATPVAPTPVVESVVAPTPVDLDSLIAQQRAINEQVKAAKAAMPTKSKLERVIERQANQPDLWLRRKLLLRVVERAKAGQDATEAVDAVLALYRSGLLEALIPATEEDHATN